jgi:hypothetical protein
VPENGLRTGHNDKNQQPPQAEAYQNSIQTGAEKPQKQTNHQQKTKSKEKNKPNEKTKTG